MPATRLKFTEKELKEWKECEEGQYFDIKFNQPFIVSLPTVCINGSKQRNREIELRMKIFPKVWIKEDYEDDLIQSTIITVMLCEKSQVKILRSVKLEYKLKVKSLRMKVHDTLVMAQNEDTGFSEGDIKFIRTEDIEKLSKGLDVEITVNKIKYFKNSKKRKRTEIEEYVLYLISNKTASNFALKQHLQFVRNCDNDSDLKSLKATKRRKIKRRKLSQQNQEKVIVQTSNKLLCELQEKQKLLQENQKLIKLCIDLKKLSEGFPDVDNESIKWAKNCKDKSIKRSLQCQNYRNVAQFHPKYQQSINSLDFIIENNPIIKNCKYRKKDRDEIKEYFRLNTEGAINPSIYIKTAAKSKEIKALNKVLGLRQINNCKVSKLNGEIETFTKMDLPKGVILGQYCGDELLKDEWQNLFNGTKQELQHIKYLHGSTLKIKRNYAMINGKTIEFFIDPTNKYYQDMNDEKRKSPLIFINDCRANIEDEELIDIDEERMNCEYIDILVNNWPSILVRTTKNIKAGETLWINYGASYTQVMEEIYFMEDRLRKRQRATENVLKKYFHENNMLL